MSGIAPNTITLVSLLAGCLAGVAYALASRGPGFYLLGGALVAISGLSDSLDGIVARMYGRTSRTGDFLDHFCDRLINVAIFAGLAFSPGANPVLGLGTVVVVMLNSYLGTQIEASFGQRYYGGLGKAELFVGLVVGSMVLAVFPDTVVDIALVRLTLVNLFFVLLAAITLVGLVHRFRYAMRLCAGEDSGEDGSRADTHDGGAW